MLLRTHTTGIHYTDESVDWAVLRKNRTGTEIIQRDALPIPVGFFEQDDAPLFPVDLLESSRKEFKGIITVSLPSSALLMHVLELPSANPDELLGMVELQMDQLSPFSLDQMAVSFEVLKQAEDHSRVLAVAVRRDRIDRLGELFKEQAVYIRSLDAEILAWWSLLIANGNIPVEGRVILLLRVHTEFSMVIIDHGVPVCFRSLELFNDFSNERIFDEIAEEIRYTLLSLETAYPPNGPCQTEIWTETPFPTALTDRLRTVSPRGVNEHDLDPIPPLSEGLALRSADRDRQHIELVPREWIDLQRRLKIMKIATGVSIAVLCVWLAVISITATLFAVQKADAEQVQKEAARYAGPARAAQDARAEKDSLERYADRSTAVLECLREISRLLPDSLELNSFNYTKGKAIHLRGSGPRTEPIYNYFQKLGASDRFKGIQNERQSMQIKQGQRQEGFSVTIQLPETAAMQEESQ